MTMADEEFRAGLLAAMQRALPGVERIDGLRRLSAGATLQTWSFDAVAPDRTWPLILRRSPGGLRAARTLSLPDEAALVRALRAAGAPVAEVVYTVQPEDALGDGFVMIRIPGETIPRKILRDAEFDSVRGALVGQLARAAAKIHATDPATVPANLRVAGPRGMVDEFRGRYEAYGVPRPVLELAFRWLDDHLPAEPARPHLVHGDFRHGNVIVGPGDGLRAVLAWEIAHLGDPVEDLAWLCLPPWRFGNLDLPAGGLGTREALVQAYEAAAGTQVDPARLRFWEMMGSMRWAVGCAGMLEWFRSGRDRTVERAMIARRVSESEMDLMRLICGSA